MGTNTMKIKVKEVIENPDGSARITVDYDEEFLEHVKVQIGKEEPDEGDIQEYILHAIDSGLTILKEKHEQDDQ
jgi:hypothetical protein